MLQVALTFVGVTDEGVAEYLAPSPSLQLWRQNLQDLDVLFKGELLL